MAQRSQTNRSRGGNRGGNNNPEGRNQYSNGWIDTAKDHPLSTAAAAAGAAAAGVFLWSRRNQISEQVNRLSNQITDWADSMQSYGGGPRELALTEGPNESSAIEASRATPKRRGTTASNGRGGRTAKARTTAGRAVPQSTTM